jgi:hypothetical protein
MTGMIHKYAGKGQTKKNVQKKVRGGIDQVKSMAVKRHP